MSYREAKEALAGPLRFGDARQIRAKHLLERHNAVLEFLREEIGLRQEHLRNVVRELRRSPEYIEYLERAFL